MSIRGLPIEGARFPSCAQDSSARSSVALADSGLVGLVLVWVAVEKFILMLDHKDLFGLCELGSEGVRGFSRLAPRCCVVFRGAAAGDLAVLRFASLV